MLVYYINLLLILGLAFPLCIIKPNRIKNIAYLIVTFGYMWFLATFREGIGFDYRAYIEIFENVKAAGSMEALLGLPYEYGFSLLTKLMTLFVSSTVVMYGIYAAIVLLPVAWFIWRYCKEHMWISVWLFVTLTFFYTSMNFIRQSISCSIVLLGYSFLKNKKIIPFFAVVILASLFHITALIIIPIYFVCHIRLGKITGIVYPAVTLALYFASGYILDFATNYIYTYYKGTYYIDRGFSMSYLIIPGVIFAGCLALKPVWEKRVSESTMLLNLMMYNLIIWLFITKHFILERFSMPVYIFVLLALPSALASLKASPEEYARRDELMAASHGKNKGKGKGGKSSGEKDSVELRQLKQKISDHQKYYWSAVAAVLLVTLIYNEVGQQVSGFHGVFPYHSVFEWINRLW